MYASISLGGPSTLAEVRDDPEIVVRILQGEWDRSHATLGAMHSAILRLIDLTVEDRQQRAMLRGRITAGLYLKPRASMRWDVLPVITGGTAESFTHGPTLTVADLTAMVVGVGQDNNPWIAARSPAIVALACFSAVSTMEIPDLKWEQLEWLDVEAPWCALVKGVRRRGHFWELPVMHNAEAQLRRLQEDAQSRFPKNPYMFAPVSGEGHVSYWSVKVTIRKAMDAAGISRCDDLAVKRAYAAHLKTLGFTDEEVRDASGLRSMVSVDARLRQHRWANAARLAQEFNVLNLQKKPAEQYKQQLQLSLDKADG